MNKPILLYYTDCSFFAGCENMLVEFLNNDVLNANYSVKLIYKYSDAYKTGLSKRTDVTDNILGVRLPDNERAIRFIKKSFSSNFLKKTIGFPVLFFWKYYCILFSIIALYKSIRNINVSILHINNGGYPAAPTCYSMMIAARLCGIKRIVYVVNNVAEGYKNPLRWFDYPLDKFVKKNVRYFVTGSKFAMGQLKEVLNIPDNKLVNIPNGINPQTIGLTPADLKKMYGIPHHRTIFLTGAVLTKRKGHIYLLEAIRYLKYNCNITEMPVFIFAGAGEEKENIEAYISKHKLQDLVILTGNVSNIFDFINAADAVILPSISHEDFPFIIIEAMSLSKPVIGTLIAGMPEQIVDNATGYIIEAANSEALLQAIKNLLDRSKRERFGNEALKRFNENYTAAISVGKYKELYDKLLC